MIETEDVLNHWSDPAHHAPASTKQDIRSVVKPTGLASLSPAISSRNGDNMRTPG